jgi:esterase/lipase
MKETIKYHTSLGLFLGVFLVFLFLYLCETKSEETKKKSPTDYYKFSQSTYVKMLNEPDDVFLGGVNLSSEMLLPLTTCTPTLKRLVIEYAPKINDDTSIIDVLEYQKDLQSLAFYDVNISDKTLMSVAKLNHLKELVLKEVDFVTWMGIYYLSQTNN